MRKRCPALFAALIGLVGAAPAEAPGDMNLTPPAAVAVECARDGASIQKQPAACFGKNVYLVAWSDGSRMLGKETADIYAARVEAGTGKALDPKGIVVCRAANLQDRPAVAFDGSNFLVAWQDLRGGADYDIYAARVAPDGRVLDPDSFPVVKRAGNQAWPAVAFAGGQYVVVWMDAREYPVYGLYFARVTPDGKVLDGDGLALDIEDPARIAKARPAGPTWLGDKYYWWQHLASRTTPAIASDGKRCLVAYMREYPFAECGRPAVTARLLDPGDPKAGEPVKVTGGPSPAWTGKGWALGGPVWKEGWTPTPMLGAGYLPEGVSLAPASQPRAKAENPSATIDVVAAFGGGYNVGKGSTASFPSAAAFNGKHTLVAMHYAWRPKQGQGPVFAILLARVETDNALKVLDAQPLVAATATNPAAVNAPALAPGPGGECLLVYEDDAETAKCRVAAQIVRP